jgi:L-serine dehydratase
MGQWPDRIDPSTIESRIGQVLQEHCLMLDGSHPLAFDYGRGHAAARRELLYSPQCHEPGCLDGQRSLLSQTRWAAASSSSKLAMCAASDTNAVMLPCMNSTVVPNCWLCARPTT